MENKHLLLITLPYQSHLNPTLQLAKKVTRAGARVTFVTTVTGLSHLKTRPSLDGLSYASISDGYENATSRKPLTEYFQEFRRVGPENLQKLLLTKTQEGQKVDFLIYGLCLPWVAEVAREIHTPSAFFFVQSAAAFSVYQHLCGTHAPNTETSLAGDLKLPGLPSLTHAEIPNFLFPEDPIYPAMAPILQEHIQTLQNFPNPRVIIHTFDELERESIEAISNHVNVFPIGPLIPSETEDTFVSDLFPISDRETYRRWLDSKPEKSVIYVAFGSLIELQKKQREEIHQGLIQSGRPFFWVLRNQDEEEMKSSKDGLIVRWCLQMEVLNHTSIGCFVTHCGWNSIMESIVGGVAIVGCPQFADQKMNMKMVESLWESGVRAEIDDDGVVGRAEIGKCLEVVMGGGKRGQEIRGGVEKWKRLVVRATKEGTSSYENSMKFFECLK